MEGTKRTISFCHLFSEHGSAWWARWRRPSSPSPSPPPTWSPSSTSTWPLTPVTSSSLTARGRRAGSLPSSSAVREPPPPPPPPPPSHCPCLSFSPMHNYLPWGYITLQWLLLRRLRFVLKFSQNMKKTAGGLYRLNVLKYIKTSMNHLMTDKYILHFPSWTIRWRYSFGYLMFCFFRLSWQVPSGWRMESFSRSRTIPTRQSSTSRSPCSLASGLSPSLLPSSSRRTATQLSEGLSIDFPKSK